MPMKVFISWSGSLGKTVAEALKDHILDVPGIDPWMSSQNIDAGAPYFREIERAATECDAAIGCITPGATQRPWVNFEFGLIFGHLQNFKILLFDESLSGPLAHIHAFDGINKDHLERLLDSLLSDRGRANRHIERVYDAWKRIIEEALRAHSSQIQLGKTAESLRDAILRTSSTDAVSRSLCFRAILSASLARLGDDLRGVQDSYGAPQNEYPYHLVEIQHKYTAKVDAIALLQQEEQFWQRSIGRAIRDTACRESRRVFVVRSPVQLEEHWETLLSHAKSYKVFILSYDDLARHFEDKLVRDFSIIDIQGSQVVAAYDSAAVPPRIQYWANASTVSEYATGYSRVLQRALLLNPEDSPELDTVRTEIFAARALTPLDRRPIEMSAYIPIEDYDAHEEKHAYYVDMMEKMIREFREQFPDSGGPYRVLELGAGTGLFTRRLAKIPSIDELVALEIDWACYNRLYFRLHDLSHVRVYNEDSRRFNPTGRFHAVFSSFADHHIKSKDKVDYLANVRRNLMPNGLFIVGDEFLPAHDPRDREQRVAALSTYHGHIIELAEKAGESVLVELEAAALKSGIDEVGDFKQSCEEFERHLSNSGFAFRKNRIGPEDDAAAARVGGVYVYVSRATSSR